MRQKPILGNAGRALTDHLLEKAAFARMKYGDPSDYGPLLCLLDDREIVRYPTRVRFDAVPLEPGEFAKARPLGQTPSDGFCVYVHPQFQQQPDILPLLIAYHLVTVNYGHNVTHEEAKLFGASLMGMSVDDYDFAVCRAADSLPSDELSVFI